MRIPATIRNKMLLATAALAAPVLHANAEQRNILVLSSYNPEANGVAVSINSMEQALKSSRADINITVESLGYDYLSELPTWSGKMKKLLDKYSTPDKKPDIIITLGQEALSAYLSQDVAQSPDIPVICGMCSRNYIELPKSKDTTGWKPETHDITEVAAMYNVVGGHFYSYDIEKNISLIHNLFPHTETVAFLSDNSYGGICMKSLVRDYASNHRDVKFQWLDGRDMTIQTATDTIAHLGGKTALMIGTWRFDKDSRYYVTSSLSMIRQNNKKLPVITISSVGLYDCAIGGYIPDYQNIGLLLTKSITQYLETGTAQMNFIPSHYVFNADLLDRLNVSCDKLPEGYKLINEKVSFVRQYSSQIAIIALIIIIQSIILTIAVHNLLKTRRLKSELERKQQELIIAKNRAEANSTLKTSFLANMSHEIRTPLNAVVGFSQVIATQYDSLTPEERDRIVEIVNKNCNLLTGLINSILDISRIEAGKAHIEVEPLNLVEVCQTMLSSVQMANKSLPIEFTFKCETDKLMFNTDRQRFQQVLINLLGNAVKFTQQGLVSLSLESDGAGGVKVAVTDTGKGIPPDKAEDVFNRFIKLNEYSNGAGLGLSLCRIIVEKFRGRIWVDTTYTSGARFVFTLPPITKDDIV